MTDFKSPYTIPVDYGSTIQYIKRCHEFKQKQEYYAVKSITVRPTDYAIHLQFIDETSHILFDVQLSKKDASDFGIALREVLEQYE
jgi:hypothetical protein